MKKIPNIYTASLEGLNGSIIIIEADTSNNLPAVSIVGLPDVVIQESKERIRSAIRNSELPFPRTKVTINLAPADIKKEGTHYDVPIAITILQATLQQNNLTIEESDLFVGELGLSGEVRGVKGILPMILLAKEKGFTRVFIPFDNVPEAKLVKSMRIVGMKTLKGVVEHVSGQNSDVYTVESKGIEPEVLDTLNNTSENDDFAYIQGQEHVKRALEIAAAGNHNIFMSGAPGAGKTLLARALATILPSLTEQEVIEITKLYSIAGESLQNGVVCKRPFRQPHHSASVPSLVGGGNIVRPGEISMAHRGVLFLDELGEFSRSVLESLRQPLEENVITIARAKGSYKYPANFLLVVAQNPCPCGFYGDSKKECTCTLGQVQKYHQKISGPLLDRIDMHIEVPAVAIEKLIDNEISESSRIIRNRVNSARVVQQKRYSDIQKVANADITVQEIKKCITIKKEAEALLQEASESLGLSARGYFRVLRVARTIADLDSSEDIGTQHIAEAIQFRQKVFSH